MTAIAHDSAWLDSLSIPELYCELALAASRLASAHLSEARNGWPAICRECDASDKEDLLHIPHREGCRAGAVSRVLWTLSRRDGGHALNLTPPHATQRKETTAPEGDSTGAAAREMRPRAIPFLVTHNALPGLHGEPWAMDSDGSVHDATGNTVAEPVGCDLVEPDDARALERIVTCVNYCDGISSADLVRGAAVRIGGAQ